MAHQSTEHEWSRLYVEDGVPHRVLVISADMGGGHNATAAALEEAAGATWPRSDIRRLDALDVMGPGIGALFRRIYVGNVESTPWLYEFFYASLWRHRWFSHASKRFTGSWCGRRLVAHIDRFDPDVIVSTYPLASSGLAWLHRHRGLTVPTGCWVSDFAPHPFWVYPELDANFVMHECAVPAARAAEPAANVMVSDPPVLDRFRAGDQQDARRRLSLPLDRLVVLLSCGSYAFGDTEAMVRTLCGAAENVTVLAVCGRDDQARAALDRLGLDARTLVTYGWVDDMASMTRAADLAVTNAGGATALEAVATGIPVFSALPIAAHGTANADLMTVSGLCELCADLDRLRDLVATAAKDRTTLDPMRRRSADHRGEVDLPAALRWLAERRPRSHEPNRPWPMRAADAFFAHLETDGAPQEVGAVAEVDRLADGRQLTARELCDHLQPRMTGLASARRALSRRPLGWWLFDDVDVDQQVSEVVLPDERSMETLWTAASRLWAQPLPPGRPGWQMQLVRSPALRHSLFGVKLHHGLADGISALGLLDRLLDPDDGDLLVERRTSTVDLPGRWRQLSGVVPGLFSLASRGTAHRHPLNRRGTRGAPELTGVALPWSEVRRLAGSFDARPHELLLALVADALTELLGAAGLLSEGKPLRAMVPVAMRPPRMDRIFGNWTGSVSLDLPTGAMSFPERVARVRDEMRRRAGRGEAQAAEAVMTLAGMLPVPLHRWFARTVYSSSFFNTIVSYMPGPRGPRRLAGAPVRVTVPVLPLTRGVPVTVGIVVASGTVGVGVLVDETLQLGRGTVEAAVREAFTAAGGRLLILVDEHGGR